MSKNADNYTIPIILAIGNHEVYLFCLGCIFCSFNLLPSRQVALGRCQVMILTTLPTFLSELVYNQLIQQYVRHTIPTGTEIAAQFDRMLQCST